MGSRKRSRLALPKEEYKKLCYFIFERDRWRCQCCRYRSNLHPHHIVFRSQGGDDASYNMVTLCNDCHEALHDRYVVLLPMKEGQDINADEGVRLLFVNGWKPKRTVR